MSDLYYFRSSPIYLKRDQFRVENVVFQVSIKFDFIQ